MNLIILALGLISSAEAYEQTDYMCLNNCTAQGYMYNLCKQRCTFESGGTDYSKPQQTDYVCLNNCSAAGYQYNFCKQKCSY
jgi:hypothetical protein